MKRYRHKFLTFREIRFCVYYSFFINGTNAARLAGYSKHSAKWQAHRLWHDLAVLIFYDWYMSIVTSGTRYLPWIDDKILKHDLARFNIKVHQKDLNKGMAIPTGIPYKAMDKGTLSLIEKLS